jgi:carbon storage regulator
MLVLSRKLNETIVIDRNIRITVVGIRGNQVRLGIEAPGEVPILREELRVSGSPGMDQAGHPDRPGRKAPVDPSTRHTTAARGRRAYAWNAGDRDTRS